MNTLNRQDRNQAIGAFSAFTLEAAAIASATAARQVAEMHAKGISTTSSDEQGRVFEHRPDGTVRQISDERERAIAQSF